MTLRRHFYPRPPRGGRRPTSRPTTSSRSNFYPRPPRGGRRLTASVLYKVSPFLSTPSARRATPVAVRTDHIKDYFYPRPPRGGRPTQSSTKWRGSYFYPRPPRGGRRADAPFQKKSTAFLSTPSARRATMTRGWTIPACHDFYPRPPRGGRLVLPDGWEVAPYFYPRPPRGGRQGKKWSDKEVIKISIHALREEGDQRNLCTGQHSRYFYPRPPRGGRRAEESVVFGVKAISIHALREEGDVQTQTATRLGDAFLSTPSARRATVLRDTFDYDISISIHALREEGDVPPRASFSSSFYFYPRPPRGGRLNPPTQEEKAHQFLSTPSARRATTRTTYADRAQMISIHALREEGDNIGSLSPGPTQNFYPRPPRGGRRASGACRKS